MGDGEDDNDDGDDDVDGDADDGDGDDDDDAVQLHGSSSRKHPSCSTNENTTKQMLEAILHQIIS